MLIFQRQEKLANTAADFYISVEIYIHSRVCALTSDIKCVEYVFMIAFSFVVPDKWRSGKRVTV